MTPRALHPCATPDCPTPVPHGTSRCPQHTRARDRARGTRQQRGYDRDYDRTRRAWAPRVATGTIPCHRCGDLIHPTEPWDLGHDDHDRSIIRGPEHAYRCNRAAAGRAAHEHAGR